MTAATREWITIPVPGKEKRQWQVDVTFLASSYRCIFGQGCPGVLTEPAPELIQGCCSYGAHASDKKDMKKIERLAEELGDDEWQFRKRGLQRGVWKSVGKDDWRTTLAVEDEQLVDWSTSEETQTTSDGEQRKR